MAFTNPLVGGTALVRREIKSPDFVSGVSGWIIRRNGSAEFNDVVVRGTFSAVGLNGSRVDIESTPVAAIYLTPATNTGVPAWTPAIVAGSERYTGPTAVGGTLELDSPTPAGESPASVQIMSSTTDGQDGVVVVQPGLVVIGNASVIGSASISDFIFLGPDAIDIGRGEVDVMTSGINSAAVGNTETVILSSTSSKVFRANRAFRVEVSGGFNTSVATNRPIWRLRKGTTAAGQFLCFGTGQVSMAVAGGNMDCSMIAHFVTGGSDVNTQLSLTTIGSAAFNVTMTGNNGGRTVTCVDVGPASRYPNANVLV